MKLKDLGERRIIDRITGILNSYDRSKVSVQSVMDFGDDVAAIEFADRYLVMTTDQMTQSTHIPPDAKPWQIGWYAVATSLSDLAAKGASPLGLTVALGLPKERPIEFVEELITGMRDCAFNFKTTILGGDTKPNESLTITVAAIGIVKKNEFMPRRGGMPGDLIAVTGFLGEAARGYYSNDLKPLLEPMPAIEEGRALARTGFVTSSMDISDGLSNSLYQQMRLNKLRYKIHLDKLPVSAKLRDFCKKSGRSVEDMALHFGGDFTLLLTIRPEGMRAVQSAMADIFCDITVIGEIIADNVDLKTTKNILVKNGQDEELKDLGYEHFRDPYLR